MVTMIITRKSGVCAPATRKIVLSGDFAENANVSSNPLAVFVPPLEVTFTLCNESRTILGTGMTTTGPTSRVSLMSLSTRRSLHARRESDPDTQPGFFNQCFHPQRAVRISHAPCGEWVSHQP